MASYEDFKVSPYELAKAARRIASERPEHVYRSESYDEIHDENNGCHYTEKSGELGCIFGHAMAALGKPLPAARTEDSNDISGMTGTYISSVDWHRAFGLDYNYEEGLTPVVAWMRDVQRHQDDMVPWGEAVRRADEDVPEARHLTS